MLAKFREILHY